MQMVRSRNEDSPVVVQTNAAVDPRLEACLAHDGTEAIVFGEQTVKFDAACIELVQFALAVGRDDLLFNDSLKHSAFHFEESARHEHGFHHALDRDICNRNRLAMLA